MLNISVSHTNCLPGKPASTAGGQPASCAACGAPGGQSGDLLEEHQVAQGKKVLLCPLCHTCLHLDFAGRHRAGRVIWLPELSQEQLNLLCSAMFIAVRTGSAFREQADAKSIIDAAKRLYVAFERRSESIELFLGGSAVKSLIPRKSLSSPAHIASLLKSLQVKERLSQRDLARRVDGLRLLPDPRAFDKYIDRLSKTFTGKFPVSGWSELATRIAAESSREQEADHGNFSAAAMES